MNPEITLRAGSLLAGIVVVFLLGLFAWRIRVWWKRLNKPVIPAEQPRVIRSLPLPAAEAIKPQPRKVPSALPDDHWPNWPPPNWSPPETRKVNGAPDFHNQSHELHFRNTQLPP